MTTRLAHHKFVCTQKAPVKEPGLTQPGHKHHGSQCKSEAGRKNYEPRSATNFHVSVQRLKCDYAVHAEDTIIERRLVLVGGTAGTCGGMWPVHLVSLANVHLLAMLPII